MRIAFDIGGVLSKYPDVFRPLFNRLTIPPAHIAVVESEQIEVFIISDMKLHEKAFAFCLDNGFTLPPDHVVVADYETHGELCKAVACERLGIDVLIDDFPGYVATPGKPMVRLLVMPDPTLPYYADEWKTDGSEGNFGRRVRPTKVDHPWK